MKGTLLVLTALCAVQLPAQTIVQQFSAVSRGTGVVSDMDLAPTTKGSVLIAMPLELSPGVKVLSVTDNAPDGGNTYKQVPGASSSCGKRTLDIWYCERCNPGVTELKFHLSDHVNASINAFVEVAGLVSPAVVDGSGVHLTDGAATGEGLEAGPSIATTAKDFIVARYFSSAPMPTAVTPEPWSFNSSFVYVVSGASGSYRPTLTGAKAASQFCMSMAAFTAAPADAGPPAGSIPALVPPTHP
jgi:hypothetical protein